MVLGIRPEGLSPRNENRYQGQGNRIDAKVNVVEPLGDKVDLSLSIPGHDHLVCRTDAHEFGKLVIGGIMGFYVDLSRVHLFEPGDHGVNITLTSEMSHAAA